MNNAQHEAWEQILSVAKGADLEDASVLAARYLERGGYRHVVDRIGIVPSEPVEIPPAAPAAEESDADSGH